MYSTKNIEKILLANTKKSVLARKIHYTNQPSTDNADILVYVDRRAPEYIFLHYFSYKQLKTNKKTNIFDFIYSIYEQASGYERSMPNSPKSPFEYSNFQFAFIIYPYKEVITTIKFPFRYGSSRFSPNNLYTNEDTKKILKDLIKNGVITEKYKLVIDKNKYSVKNILSNKNTPIKYTKNGNLLMYHGTSYRNWQSIKQHGGLRPHKVENPNLPQSFTDSLIYLTTSFVVAKNYATDDSDIGVVLLVEVPDMNKLYVDTTDMYDGISEIIRGIETPHYYNNDKYFLNIDTNKDIIKFREQYLEPTLDGRYMNIKGLGEHNVRFYKYLCSTSAIMKAVLDKDFSVIERQMQNIERQNPPLNKLNDEEFQKVLDVLYALYKIIVKYYTNTFNTDRALRESMNSLNNKNAVAYHGRIPLSYIHGVFDLNGNKIE